MFLEDYRSQLTKIMTEKDTNEELFLQRYEMMYIIPTGFEEDEIKKIQGTINSQIKDAGGLIISEQDMGRKKFAYPILHQTTGHYGLVEFDLEKKNYKPLETKFRLSDEILRYLIIKIEPKTEEDIAHFEMIKEKIENRKKKKLQDEINDDTPGSEKREEKKEVKEIKKEIKKETTEKKEIKMPEVEKTDAKKDKDKVSLEDLDKKLDEILDDDVEL